jgi:hypothetical protein
MSLVIAAHNDREVVIASDSLSTSTKTGVKAADDSIQKVRQINPRLVFAVTGLFANDKLPFFSRFIAEASGEAGLDTALDKLFDQAVASMSIYQKEGFRMSLIGFNADKPGFRCVDVEKGKGFQALGESRRNYWASGEDEAVEHALRAIEQSSVPNKPAAGEIETALRTIVTDCIERYPQTLGMPVNVLAITG